MDVYLFEIQIDKETTGTICRKLVQKKASSKFCKYKIPGRKLGKSKIFIFDVYESTKCLDFDFIMG